jgi:hypothetical protein
VLAGLLQRRGTGDTAGMLRTLAELSAPEFLLVPTAAAADAISLVAPPRTTRHVRHLGKYADQPVPPENAFLFCGADGRAVRTADTLQTFVAGLREVDASVLVHHARRNDFSRWIADVFGERRLAGRVRKLEQRWQADHAVPLRPALVGLLGDLAA